MENNKEKLLNDLREHVLFVRSKISQKLAIVKKLAEMTLTEIRKLPQSDQMVYMDLKHGAKYRVEELVHLESSPYFMKCRIVDEKGEQKEYFFAKHEFSDQSIYSWIAPVTSIRFENPGTATYRLPDGTLRTVTILEKEQYMIVDGNVLFFAKETKDSPRELIYQEHFTKQKSEFALPEIVAQIEKAQDQVIRASHKGPLVISGPAGSGKTTLALHRVAYLTQAPDTAQLYPSKSIAVFVQDNGTKEYFSKLLPGLGIYDVHITTFSQWAFEILGLGEYTYMDRYGVSEEQKDVYEYQKLQVLRSGNISAWNKSIAVTLRGQYGNNLSVENLKLFEKQIKEKKLDRFDVTVLLRSYLAKYKKFETKREYFTFVKDARVKKTEKNSVSYALVVVDEFQNYLPEQLSIFKSCLQENTQSVIYVGDMAQQVRLGTLKSFDDMQETVLPERNIRLGKVYRNTKNILSFIKNLGYVIEIPVEVKDGPAVLERITNSAQEEIEHIQHYILEYEKGSIGIIAKDESYLPPFKKAFEGVKNIHVSTMLESQGVEFDLVCIVGMNKNSFLITHMSDVSPEHSAERNRMQRDLLYVALTRAISELHVLGSAKLHDVINNAKN